MTDRFQQSPEAENDSQQAADAQCYNEAYAQSQTCTQPQESPYSQAQPVNATVMSQQSSEYELSSKDQTLRLIAFIFIIVTIASSCWLIIPLAWLIPMAVMVWGTYKGTRPNTVALGVCTLIFASLVGGILLLVSTKEN